MYFQTAKWFAKPSRYSTITVVQHQWDNFLMFPACSLLLCIAWFARSNSMYGQNHVFHDNPFLHASLKSVNGIKALLFNPAFSNSSLSIFLWPVLNLKSKDQFYGSAHLPASTISPTKRLMRSSVDKFLTVPLICRRVAARSIRSLVPLPLVRSEEGERKSRLLRRRYIVSYRKLWWTTA